MTTSKRTFPLLAMVLIVLAHCAFTMSFESILPALARQTLGSVGGGVSFMMMAVGAGGMVTVILIAGVRGDRSRNENRD